MLTAADLKYANMESKLASKLITPDMPDYERLSQPWNLAVKQHPGAVVVAENGEDVAEAVRYAQVHGFKVAVQATGHGVVRSAGEDTILIVTSAMQEVRIDPAQQIAYVEAGVKWGKVLEMAQEFGLAPLLGSSPEVGVIGYSLGGGFGWLGRKYGMAVDSIRALEVVIANGERLRVTPQQHPDLFWGMCGGGGSLAIVTAIEIALYPVKTFFGGNMLYPIDQAKAVIQHYREWIQDVPNELTSAFAVMNFPPIPEMPDFLRGQSFIIIRGCYVGDTAAGKELLNYWLDWQAPAHNFWQELPFSQVGMVSQDPVDPAPAAVSGGWLADLSDAAIDTLIAYGSRENKSPLVIIEVRHAGGAIKQVGNQANAYGHRHNDLLLHMVGMTPTPESSAATQDYIAQFKQALGEHLTSKVYLNFLEGEEQRERISDGYLAENYRRLQDLKARFDPTDLFNHSFNIRSAR